MTWYEMYFPGEPFCRCWHCGEIVRAVEALKGEV
jgi:hypothetical protein